MRQNTQEVYINDHLPRVGTFVVLHGTVRAIDEYEFLLCNESGNVDILQKSQHELPVLKSGDKVSVLGRVDVGFLSAMSRSIRVINVMKISDE